MSTTSLDLRSRRPLWAVWAVSVGYVLAFLLLDWVSYIRPFQGLNITPWNPQAAVAIALLFWNRRCLPLVWIGLLAAELVVRGVPSNWFVTLAATAALGLSYAAIARAVEVRLDRSLALATLRDLLWLTGIIVTGALFSGTVYVSTYAVGGLGPTGPVVEAIVRYWVGDAVGMIVLLPMLLMLMDAHRRAALVQTLRDRQWWLIVALVVVLLWVVFAREDHDHFKYFYVLLLPVVWASARLGLTGAVLTAGLTQVGLIVSMQWVKNPDLSVFELQALMAVLTMTGLMLGVVIDERARAQAELNGSLRLAAAGQMASALAHELSQPLTALDTYAQASRLLVSTPDMSDGERLARLADVSERMAKDAQRASDVVKRLRDFFRTGSTQLQTVSPAVLLNEAIDAQQRRAEALNIRVDSDIDDNLQPVLVDPVQIAVVLRNLVANALDAATTAMEAGRVAVRAREHGRELLVEVRDNGAGVATTRLDTLFDAGASDKPGGMGVGLSICRAIVEAHGGRLWAEAGTSGCFCLALPLDGRTTMGNDDAA